MLKNMEKRLGEGLNIIKNRITFEINTGYYLKFLTPEKKYLEALKVRQLQMKTMKMYLLQKLLKQYCSIVLLSTTIIIKIQESCGHLFQIIRYFTQTFYIFKKINSEFLIIKVRFTGQNSKPLEIKDKINIPLVIN